MRITKEDIQKCHFLFVQNGIWADNKDDLIKNYRKWLIKNHPDKNKETTQEIISSMNNCNDLIKTNFEEFKNIIKKSGIDSDSDSDNDNDNDSDSEEDEASRRFKENFEMAQSDPIFQEKVRQAQKEQEEQNKKFEEFIKKKYQKKPKPTLKKSVKKKSSKKTKSIKRTSSKKRYVKKTSSKKKRSTKKRSVKSKSVKKTSSKKKRSVKKRSVKKSKK